MKNFSRKLTALLLILLATSSPSYADFSDVFEKHQNYEAIKYLKETGVIQGYSDGTFRPAIQVNRVEFLKIILEGSEIKLDVAANVPLKDIDNNAWYAPYVKKAYAEGWIIGYPDKTFKPSQTINKVEALKILGEVQKWNPEQPVTAPFNDTPADAWYAKYVAHAKTNGFLEENGSSFSPSGIMTRGAISEVIYRTVKNPSSIKTLPETESQEEKKITSFTPVDFKEISKNTFSKISLDETLPNIFYQNEIYTIKGNVTENGPKKATALVGEKTDDDNYLTYSSPLNTDNSFEITIHFSEPGNYYLGILPGGSGQTKVEKISVLPEIPSSEKTEDLPEATNSIEIDHTQDKTFVKLSAPSSTLKKLTVEQDSKKVTYLSRQNTNKMIIKYADFKSFQEKETLYSIETAKISSQKPLNISSDFRKSETKTFKATTHTYSEIDEEKIVSSPPSLLASTQKISFGGTLKTETQSSAYIIKPNGFVEEIDLISSSTKGTYYGKETLPSNGKFNFYYTPPKKGTYIVEIVDKNGLPTLNHPVYIGGEIPLIPDFFDLNTRTFFSGTLNLSSAKKEVLNYINESRNNHGLKSVVLDTDLSALAQSHSDDMKKNDYFSHYNLNEQTPNDRRLSVGIKTSVSENIAQDVSIKFAHEGLMRSATHRSNILDENWTKVGIGITQKEGYLLITQEFSTDEISESDLISYKNELETKIANIRSQNGLSELSIENKIQNAADELNNRAINNGETINNTMFQEVLTANSVSGNSQAIGRSYGNWSSIISSILTENVVISSSWKKMGASVKINDIGTIHAILILNNSN